MQIFAETVITECDPLLGGYSNRIDTILFAQGKLVKFQSHQTTIDISCIRQVASEK